MTSDPALRAATEALDATHHLCDCGDVDCLRSSARHARAVLRAVADDPDVREALIQHLGWADCNCDPREGTCEDWRDRLHRHEHLADAVLRVIGGDDE